MTPTRKHPNRRTQKENILAFDYRRHITLVQVLAMDSPASAIKHLCKSWHIEPGDTFEETINRLAQHAMRYHRSAP